MVETQFSSTSLQKLRDGRFYGLVDADIIVPPKLEAEFSEMALTFKNASVGRRHLSLVTLEHALSHNYLQRPQRMLIGSLRGDKTLLQGQLLMAWYLRHSLVMTTIYQMIEHTPHKIFEDFGLAVTDARRQGDTNPNKRLLANTSKLIGNSCYGKTITNMDKHRDVHYVVGDNAVSQKIMSKLFCSAKEICDSVYETTFLRHRVSLLQLYPPF